MTVTSLKPGFIQAFDFNTAYQIADANPGEIVDFDGTLPSGFFATQKIIAVPKGQNVLRLIDALQDGAFKGARSVTHSSSQERGTHVVATFGELKPATL